MGGVLVNATVGNGQFECLICESLSITQIIHKDNPSTLAAGLNVANSKPNGCINDMLAADSDKLLCVEEVLAETMNKFERRWRMLEIRWRAIQTNSLDYVNLFEKQGIQEFLKRYYDYWMHTREEVSVLHADTNSKEKVMIRGLDSYG